MYTLTLVTLPLSRIAVIFLKKIITCYIIVPICFEILQCLTIQGLSSSSGNQFGGDSGGNSGVSRAMVKERFKTFNIQFEELHQRQSQWTVPDSELRESLRLAVAEVLLPAYRSFIRRFGPLIENGKNPQKYIKFTPEDLERMLAEFFEGKTWSEQKR
ncbi:hypothetical protein CsSME_00040075 [Camellia sinensis var. sinensis]